MHVHVCTYMCKHILTILRIFVRLQQVLSRYIDVYTYLRMYCVYSNACYAPSSTFQLSLPHPTPPLLPSPPPPPPLPPLAPRMHRHACSGARKKGFFECIAPGYSVTLMGLLYYVWCVYSPNDIGNGPDVKVFFFSIGIIFSNICVSWLRVRTYIHPRVL